MWPVAQTNLQLYNQLRARGWQAAELALVHRAYELTVTLYSGYFQNDGKPFVAHTAGVASIIAHLGRPPEVVAAAVLHNVYGNADFGDARIFSGTSKRRRVLRDAVGDGVEALVYGFLKDMRLAPRLRVYDDAAALDTVAVDSVLIDLADFLEKHVDSGVLYASQREHLIDEARREKEGLVATALRLGYPELASALTEAIDETLAASGATYAGLEPADRRPYLKLIVPRSCVRLPHLLLRPLARRLRDGLRRQLRSRRSATSATPEVESGPAPVGDSSASVL